MERNYFVQQGKAVNKNVCEMIVEKWLNGSQLFDSSTLMLSCWAISISCEPFSHFPTIISRTLLKKLVTFHILLF